MQTITRELTEAVDLCLGDGALNPDATGWSRRMLHRCNLRGRFPRKKRWEYWCVTGPAWCFSATIANIDYAGLAGVYLLEYASKRFAEQGAFHPFAHEPRLSETLDGDVAFRSRALEVRFENAPTQVRIVADARKLQGIPFHAECAIHRPADLETLNVVVPWNAHTFQFTSKQICLPVEGEMQWGAETIRFDAASAFACLDYGRGIWPYRTVWNWGSFSTRAGGDTVGFTAGAQWTDGAGMNENGIVLNGRLHKIFDDIAFDYDRNDFMKPWHIHTVSSDTVDLQFTPFYEKRNAANLLLIASEGHQMFGRYSGVLRVEGRTIDIRDAVGWAEEHRARW